MSKIEVYYNKALLERSYTQREETFRIITKETGRRLYIIVNYIIDI